MFRKMPLRPEATKHIDFLRCATAAYAVAYLTWEDDYDATPAPKINVEFNPDNYNEVTNRATTVLNTLFGSFHLNNLGTNSLKDALLKFNNISRGTPLHISFEAQKDHTLEIPEGITELMSQAQHLARELVYKYPNPKNISFRPKL